MTYPIPPSIARVTGTTNAAANTLTTITLIAAPAANQARRIVFLSCQFNQNTAAGSARLMPRDATSTIWLPGFNMTQTAAPSEYILLPEPGLQLASGQALVVDTYGSAVSMALTFVVGYYTDSVP